MTGVAAMTATEANEYKNITKLCSTILDLPPSCIEFSLKLPEYFVVGTYNLEKEETAESTEADIKKNDGDEL